MNNMEDNRNNDAKNSTVNNLLGKQKKKRERKQPNNPLIDRGESEKKNPRPGFQAKEDRKSKKEVADERRSILIPKKLHKKLKLLSAKDDVAIYTILEKAIRLYEEDQRKNNK